ncbi:MAG: DUF2065 domain-containing protein [Nitrospinota bacterium]
MEIFLSAIGLVLIFEGLPYFISPDSMKNMARFMSEADSRTLRFAGFALMATGLILLYFIHGF